MSLDLVHIAVTALLFIGGLISIMVGISKVSPVRRVAYALAIPLWAGFSILYVWSALTYTPAANIGAIGVVLRLLIFGIALEGILVPHIDRLEAKSRPQEIRLIQTDDGVDMTEAQERSYLQGEG